MKRIPIGISDYKKLIDENYYYVDKTLLIKEIIEKGGEVALIPRPRRFGKTINLSMLRYFFEKTEKSNAYLFEDKLIWQHQEYRALQGKYPVIFISFKDIKHSTWDDMYEDMKGVIAAEFTRHSEILTGTIKSHEKKKYIKIMEEGASKVTYGKSLLFLSQLLAQHYNQKVTVIIDEYDTPIHAAYFHGFYGKIIEFMRSLLSSVLKDNAYLERSVLTGILFLAKAGIFSGLNNLNVFTLTSSFMADKFGFTKQEVEQIARDYKLEVHSNIMQAWYDGYHFGAMTHMYNPWSVLMCTQNLGKLDTYWVHTSDNALLKELIAQGSSQTQEEFAQLLKNKTISKKILESITLPELKKNPNVLWSLLLYTGYLTYLESNLVGTKREYALAIPNLEVKELFEQLIENLFVESVPGQEVQAYLDALLSGNLEYVQKLLQDFIINHTSNFDLPKSEAENSYHMFMLGLLVVLANTHIVKSNRESGLGRYDIMLIPKDLTKNGIIIEFKKVQAKETLKTAARRALEQIHEKKYAQELHALGIKNIIAYGIASQGKQVLVTMEQL